MAADRRITCEEALRALDDYIDREISQQDAERVGEHLRTCEACLREFTFERAAIDQIRGKLRKLAAPLELRARVQARLARREEG